MRDPGKEVVKMKMMKEIVDKRNRDRLINGAIRKEG